MDWVANAGGAAIVLGMIVLVFLDLRRDKKRQEEEEKEEVPGDNFPKDWKE